MDLVTLAIAKIEASLSQVVDHRLTDNGIVILVNFGIAGVKKFSFTVEDLQPDTVETQKVEQAKLRGKKR